MPGVAQVINHDDSIEDFLEEALSQKKPKSSPILNFSSDEEEGEVDFTSLERRVEKAEKSRSKVTKSGQKGILAFMKPQKSPATPQNQSISPVSVQSIAKSPPLQQRRSPRLRGIPNQPEKATKQVKRMRSGTTEKKPKTTGKRSKPSQAASPKDKVELLRSKPHFTDDKKVTEDVEEITDFTQSQQEPKPKAQKKPSTILDAFFKAKPTAASTPERKVESQACSPCDRTAEIVVDSKSDTTTVDDDLNETHSEDADGSRRSSVPATSPTRMTYRDKDGVICVVHKKRAPPRSRHGPMPPSAPASGSKKSKGVTGLTRDEYYAMKRADADARHAAIRAEKLKAAEARDADLRRRREEKERVKREESERKRAELQRQKEERERAKAEEADRKRKLREEEAAKRQAAKEALEAEKERKRLAREAERQERLAQKEAERLEKEKVRLQKEAERAEKLRLEEEAAAKRKAEKEAEEHRRNKKLEKQKNIMFSFMKKAEEKPDSQLAQLSKFQEVRVPSQYSRGICPIADEDKALSDSGIIVQSNKRFLVGPFVLNPGQVAAPINALTELPSTESLDKNIFNGRVPDSASTDFGSYFDSIALKRSGSGVKTKNIVKGTLPRTQDGDYVQVLSFEPSYRPALFGRLLTTTKHKPSGRKPFVFLSDVDYDIDSDEEWEEEEEEGESLKEDDEDEEDDEDMEETDSFVVPHGYLSDDEGVDAEEKRIESNNGEGEAPTVVKGKQKAAIIDPLQTLTHPEAQKKLFSDAHKAVMFGDDTRLNHFSAHFYEEVATVPIYDAVYDANGEIPALLAQKRRGGMKTKDVSDETDDASNSRLFQVTDDHLRGLCCLLWKEGKEGNLTTMKAIRETANSMWGWPENGKRMITQELLNELATRDTLTRYDGKKHHYWVLKETSVKKYNLPKDMAGTPSYLDEIVENDKKAEAKAREAMLENMRLAALKANEEKRRQQEEQRKLEEEMRAREGDKENRGRRTSKRRTRSSKRQAAASSAADSATKRRKVPPRTKLALQSQVKKVRDTSDSLRRFGFNM
eukprot:Clim_evm124s147 gene=Clim_evmTU124s147